jgi:Domain of unknown function (DUF4386)
MGSVTRASPRQLARMAGVLYLINIVGGAFAITVVPSMLVVHGDAAATAQNIQAHELLYRSGLAAHLLVTTTNVPLAVIFYELFSVVNRRLALLDAFFILVATAIEAAGLLNQFTPLVLLGGGPYGSALPRSQIQALAYLPIDLSSIDYTIHTVFFGLDILCFAYLVFRSTFLPRALGVLLAIDALAYLIYSFTDILAPDLAVHLVPWIQLPALIGEGSLCVWLLAVGLDADRWKLQASMQSRRRPRPWKQSGERQVPEGALFMGNPRLRTCAALGPRRGSLDGSHVLSARRGGHRCHSSRVSCWPSTSKLVPVGALSAMT